MYRAKVFKAFVGNVPWTMATNELKQFATKYGPVSAGVVLFDKNSGMNKGYGFVSFATQEGYEAALKSTPASNFVDGQYLYFQPNTS